MPKFPENSSTCQHATKKVSACPTCQTCPKNAYDSKLKNIEYSLELNRFKSVLGGSINSNIIIITAGMTHKVKEPIINDKVTAARFSSLLAFRFFAEIVFEMFEDTFWMVFETEVFQLLILYFLVTFFLKNLK